LSAADGDEVPVQYRPTPPPHGWPAEREEVKRDRELQEQFRRDQTRLRELLDGRKTTTVGSALPAIDLQKYDPQTASLIRVGLIVPKWNISKEVPEHAGAAGNAICFAWIEPLHKKYYACVWELVQ